MNARILHLDRSSNRPIGEIGEKQLSVFGSRGGPNLPLYARTPLVCLFE